MQLGMIGLGRMGGNIVRRLMKHGHTTVVYDKDPTATDALCRNFLGVIADTNIKVANSALNWDRSSTN